MPQTYLAYPPTQLRITGGSLILDGVEVGLTVEDRRAIASSASKQLIQEWGRQAIAIAPRRSGRLIRSIKPIAGRGLELLGYGGFQEVGQLPMLTQAWQQALRATPVAVRSAVLQRRPDFSFRDSAGKIYRSLQKFAGTSTGEVVIDAAQEKAFYFAVALILVKLS